MAEAWTLKDLQLINIINDLSRRLGAFPAEAGLADAAPTVVPGGSQLRTTFARGLTTYWALLGEWNARINLTAVRDATDALERHALDSLIASAFIPSTTRSLVDVGSGAGFPGAIMALARPDVAVTLVESNHKKCAFLGTLKRELPLPNLTVEAARVETLVARGASFDAASSRATLDLPDWLALGRQLAARGRVIGMEGGEQRELPAGAHRYPYRLGASQLAIIVVDA